MEEKIIVAASRNKHKIEEIEAITKKFGMSIISRDEAGVPKVEIEEDGETFEENSFKKANEIMKLAREKGTPVLEGVANDVRLKAIDVTKKVLEKLESEK